MLRQLAAFIEELKDRPVVVVYHHPEWVPPTVDFNLSACLRFIPHKAVPIGILWVVNNGPSGRIITEE